MTALRRNDFPPRLRPSEHSHALAFAGKYDERAAQAYRRAAYFAAVNFREPAKRLQADAAHFSRQARKYRFLLLGVGPEERA